MALPEHRDPAPAPSRQLPLPLPPTPRPPPLSPPLLTLPAHHVWASLTAATQAQVQQTLLRIIQEVLDDAARGREDQCPPS